MIEAPHYSASELITVLSARQLKDGQIVFAGIGTPLLAATLAQRLHCPGLTILFEGGVIGAFIITMIVNILFFAHVNQLYESFFEGVFLLIAGVAASGIGYLARRRA